MDFINIVEDIYLLDFYERKNKKTLTIDCQEVTSLGDYYKDDTFLKEDKVIPYDWQRLTQKIENTLNSFSYSSLEEILILCKGKLCLYGTSLIDILRDPSCCGRIQLCFHSCTVEEAKVLMSKCLNLLKGKIYYTDGIVVGIDDYAVEFSFVIYKDREELLRNIGSTSVRCCYDPIGKYLTTVNTAISIATRMCPLDVKIDYNDMFTADYNGIKFIFHGENANFIFFTQQRYITIYDCKGDPSCNTNKIKMCDRDVCITKRDLLKEGTIKFMLFGDSPYKSFDPRIRFGKDYAPIIIGIDDDKFIAFNNVRKLFNVNDDTFRLLCEYWYVSEVMDAKKRLLNP